VTVDIKYPLAKEKITPAVWSILHNYSALKVKDPDNPRRLKAMERNKFRLMLNETIESISCEDCKVHAKEYIKANPPNVKTDLDMFKYTCDFHNNVNTKLGKPTYDCNIMLGAPVCSTCHNVNHDPKTDPSKQTNNHTNSVSPPLEIRSIPVKQTLSVQDSFQDYKNVSRRVIENICLKEGIPVPEIIFQECPGNKETSCTHLPLTPKGEHYKGAPVKMYLNPNQYSPRTLIHETVHYISSYKGNPRISEDEVEKRAQKMLLEHFPSDKVINVNSPMSVYRMDSAAQPTTLQERIAARQASWKRTFPTYANIGVGAPQVAPQQAIAVAQPQPQVTPLLQRPLPEMEPAPEPQRGMSDGFMAMLDPVFTPIGNALGLSAKDVNEAHTPALIAGAYNGVSDIYLNTFGSFLTSLLGATATLLAGTLGKDQIVYSDRKFLVELGANLLWNPLRFIINPRTQEDLMKDAGSFGTALSTMSIDAIKDSIVYQPPPKTYAATDLSPQQVRVLQKAGMPPTAKQDINRGVTQSSTFQRVGGREGGIEIEVDPDEYLKKYPQKLDLDDAFDEDPLAKPMRSQFNRISLG